MTAVRRAPIAPANPTTRDCTDAQLTVSTLINEAEAEGSSWES
ncbi:hypothetical protein [Kitasatospora sp. GAS204B]|nr:hypothetical protein [Kitasatospora sp. GAS204B]MDH6119583.1 hypothetical protein [Kitasatospora sp. GAS204B]